MIAACATDPKAVEQIFKAIADKYKEIDALFVEACIAKFARLAQSTPMFDDAKFPETDGITRDGDERA